MQKKYRPNAGIVVFRKDKKVLVCARADRQTNNWQFPQGGIDKGETPAEAAVRELSELILKSQGAWDTLVHNTYVLGK